MCEISPDKPHIGLFGSPVNNLYQLYRQLRGHVYCRYLFDGQSFCANHPSWLSHPFAFNEDEYLEINFPLWLERDSNVKKAEDYDTISSWMMGREVPWIRILRLLAKKKSFSILYLLFLLAKRDRIFKLCFLIESRINILCGIEAIILGSLADRPYHIVPHGADLRLANGYLECVEELSTPLRFIIFFLVRHGCDGALAICSHDPAVFLTPGISPSLRVKKLYKPTSKRSFGLPSPNIDYKLYGSHPRLEKHRSLDRQYVLVPTSIEYDRKKINWVVDWLVCHRECEVDFVFMGWGRDSESAKQALTKSSNVIFLNEFVSSPLVYFLMSRSLAIIDSFGEPGYGTAVIEASALGIPVVGRVDLSQYGDSSTYSNLQAPPIFNCATVEDVNISLKHICYDFHDKQARSKAHFDWYTDSHSTSAIARDWIPVLVDKAAETF